MVLKPLQVLVTVAGNVTLNSSETTDQDAYIFANRPVAGSNVSIRWNETTDNWELTNDGTTFNAIATSATGDITGISCCKCYIRAAVHQVQ